MLYINEPPVFWSDILGVDLETTGLDPHLGKLLTLALSDGKDAWVFTRPDKSIKKVLADPNILKIFHNATFDMKWLHRSGINVQNAYCSLVAEQLIHAGLGPAIDLQSVMAQRCGVLVEKDTRQSFVDHPGFQYRPLTGDQLQYIVQDVLHLPRIYQSQLQDVHDAELSVPLQIEMDILPAVMELEYYGLHLDVDLWNSYQTEFEDQTAHHQEQLLDLLDGFSADIKRAKGIETVTAETFNFNSLAHIKAAMTWLGEPIIGTNKDTVLKPLLLKSDNERAKAFIRYLLNYRHWRDLAKWDYPKYVHPVTGNVHPSWWQYGAETGRFSCSKPNLTNVNSPTEGEPNLRHLWVPDNAGYKFTVADYSQQEVRCMAETCGDPDLLEDCKTDDVYIAFAEKLFDKKVDKKSDERYIAKQFVLATGYGSGIARLAEASGLPESKCKEVRELIRKTYPRMADFAGQMYQFANTYGYVQALDGRRRYFMQGNKRIYTEAANHPIQGLAASMLKRAMYMIYTDLKDNHIDGRVAHICHDEIIVQVPNDIAQEYAPRVQELMEQAGYELCPHVTHIAEAEIKDKWDK